MVYNNFKLNGSYLQITKMFLSISFAMFIPQINYFINTFFISQLGEKELAKYTICGMYYLFFTVLGVSISSGLQALMGNSLGASNNNKFIQLFANAKTICLCFAIISIIITYLFIDTLLNSFISQKDNISDMANFIKIRILGLPFLFLYLLRNTLFINLNKSHYLIYITIIETASNIFFDYTFIFGNLNFPKLNNNGAAIASVVAEIIGFIISYVFIHFIIKKIINIKFQFKFNIKLIKEILLNSSPIILQHFIAIFSWQIFFFLIEHTSQRNLAISGIMRTMIGLLGIASWALGSVTNSLISNLIGQKNYNLLYKSILKICIVGFISSCFINIFIYFNSTFLLSFFIKNLDFITESKKSLTVILIAIYIMNIGCVFLNALIGAGETKKVLYAELICVIIYLIYVYFIIVVFNLPLVWAWASEILYWSFMLFITLLFLLHWYKFKIKIIKKYEKL